MDRDYGLLSVKELKIELKRRKAKCTGKKEDLVQRLRDYDRNNNFILEENVMAETTEAEPVIFTWPTEDLFKTVDNTFIAPPIDIGHINQYFFDTVRGQGVTMSVLMQRKGFNMMKENFISALVAYVHQHHFYRGHVNSEYTKRMAYFVKIVIDVDGQIVEAHCECVAGKGPKAICKHVATILFAIQNYREHNIWYIRNTCTEKKQLWHMPKKRTLEVSPKKAEDLNLHIHKFSKKKKDHVNSCYDPRLPLLRKVPNFSDSAKNLSISYSHAKPRSLAISGCLNAPSYLGICNDHDYLSVPPQRKIIYNRIEVTKEKAKRIEQRTRGQSSSNCWHEERSLRITASKVGNIINMTEKANKFLFANNIVSPKHFSSVPTEYGKLNEKNAIAAYTNATTNQVVPCGLIISYDYPYLAGSPDGLIAQYTVLEVKCPYLIRNQYIDANNLPYLEVNDGVLYLKKKSHYYYQVQTQMFVAQRDFCDFVIWTKCDYKCLSVKKDLPLINNVILPKMKDFYDKYMVPTLFEKFYS